MPDVSMSPTSALPTVSVVVPTFNEERSIAPCLDTIINQDYPHGLIEVLLVDGASTDGTRTLVQDTLSDSDFARVEVVVNENRTRPSNMNVGLKLCQGDIICRVDAKSRLQPFHIRRCVEALVARPDISVIGGGQVARSDSGSVLARGIARALRNPYATGWARYRRGGSSGPADTVYLGAFRTEQLAAEGGWDERFLINEDFELNQRMRRHGSVWYDAGLGSSYSPRPEPVGLFAQYRRFGRWKAAGWLEAGIPLSPRHGFILALPALALPLGAMLSRRTRILATLAAGLLLDAAVKEPVRLPERAVSVAAIGILSSAWYLGVTEQSLRFVAGERLLPARRDRHSRMHFQAASPHAR